MADFVVKSKVKELASGKGYRMGADALERLSQHVEETITKAGSRAEANGRKTIKACDC
jgi:histone H3/H4